MEQIWLGQRERELREDLNELNPDYIKDKLVNQGIQWEFNPPGGFHFEGVWEHLIWAVRKILYSLLKEKLVPLDDESLQTLLCEVEAILNNPPITATATLHNGLDALTPNHLLQLRFRNENVCVDYSNECYSRKRWKHIQYMIDIFWKRWVKEYLPSLQRRQKWCISKKNFCVGDSTGGRCLYSQFVLSR